MPRKLPWITNPPKTPSPRPTRPSVEDILNQPYCSICLNPWGSPSKLGQNKPCKHYFHLDYIKEHVRRSTFLQRNCPLCKQDVKYLGNEFVLLSPTSRRSWRLACDPDDDIDLNNLFLTPPARPATASPTRLSTNQPSRRYHFPLGRLVRRAERAREGVEYWSLSDSSEGEAFETMDSPVGIRPATPSTQLVSEFNFYGGSAPSQFAPSQIPPQSQGAPAASQAAILPGLPSENAAPRSQPPRSHSTLRRAYQRLDIENGDAVKYFRIWHSMQDVMPVPGRRNRTGRIRTMKDWYDATIAKLVDEGGPEIDDPRRKVIGAVERVLTPGNPYHLSDGDLDAARLVREDINGRRQAQEDRTNARIDREDRDERTIEIERGPALIQHGQVASSQENEEQVDGSNSPIEPEIAQEQREIAAQGTAGGSSRSRRQWMTVDMRHSGLDALQTREVMAPIDANTEALQRQNSLLEEMHTWQIRKDEEARVRADEHLIEMQSTNRLLRSIERNTRHSTPPPSFRPVRRRRTGRSSSFNIYEDESPTD
jgi:hypothetical protein